MSDTGKRDDCFALTAEIVAAYVGHNAIAPGDIAGLIRDVHAAFVRLAGTADIDAADQPKPAVPPKRSVMPDYIVCLEDGKKFKSLRRHLRTRYQMTPEQYREKWGLPPDYPMVAPNYAAARSSLAKQMGLGQQRRTRGQG